MNIISKRVYDAYSEDDGYRILVDRLWPRGLRKEDLTYDVWGKFLAPTTEARKAFAHDPANFPAFRTRYLAELDANGEAAQFADNLVKDNRQTVTLLYAARDRTCNHSMVLGDWLAKKTGGTFIAG